MNIYLKPVSLLLTMAATLTLVACNKEDDLQLPDNQIAFEASELSFAAHENEMDLTVTFNRAAEVATTVRIDYTAEGLAYGEDFTIDPAPEGGAIQMPVAPGDQSVRFKVRKAEAALFDGHEQISFRLQSAEGFTMGTASNLDLYFREVLSKGGSMTLNGGGANFPNTVFINLAGNRQTAIARAQWELEFHSGEDDRVFLNGTLPILARAIDKYDLNAVVPEDTLGFASAMVVGPTASPQAAAWVDEHSGNPEGTAIEGIAAADAENKVYIINFNMVNPPSNPQEPIVSRGWKKVRILKAAGGYTLQYAALDADTFNEIKIDKSDTHSKVYFSFEQGIVNVAPANDRWELAWTAYTNLIPFQGAQIPYFFQDIILSNTASTEVATVMEAATAYSAFTKADIAALSFNGENQQFIGSSWRAGGGPGQGPAVLEDRYYIIKSNGENYYKLRFTSLTTDGERGRPQLQYALVD